MRAVETHAGSAESLRSLVDDEVALTVTSPPYFNAIDYDRFIADPASDWKTREYAKGFSAYGDFLALLRRSFAEVHRVTRPGGFCAVVIGTILHRKRMIPLPFDFTTAMTELGWLFHQDIVWSKTWSSSKRAGSVVQHPWPGNYYPNTMAEYILIFRKAGKPVKGARREADRIPIDALFTREISNNVWHICPVKPGRIAHPCPYPEEIVHRLVTLYSSTGDLVLDPFMGSGQTLKVARALNRRCVGYDIEAAFVNLARRRVFERYERGPQLIARHERIEPGAAPVKRRKVA